MKVSLWIHVNNIDTIMKCINKFRKTGFNEVNWPEVFLENHDVGYMQIIVDYDIFTAIRDDNK